MKIEILTYCNGFVEVEIPDDFEFLRVTYMTGDEIVEVYRRDERWGDPYLYCTLDVACEDRRRDFLDATYIVYPYQLEMWAGRQANYHMHERSKFEAAFKGFVSMYGQ